MPQPTAYDRQNSFTTLAAVNPSAPYTGTDLDEEFNAIKVTFDETLVNLKKIQRDDGFLANQSVGPDQLSASLTIGINPPSMWKVATAYSLYAAVFDGTKLYKALVAHTSGSVFATDLAAGKWELLAEFNTVAVADGSITEVKLANSAVTSIKIVDSGVTTNKIASGAVTAAKLAAGAVDTAALGSASVSTAKIQDEAVTYAKIQAVSATDKLLGRSTSGAGVVEEIACTAAGRALLDDANAAAQRTTLSAAARSQTTEPIYGVILGSLSNRDYRIVLKATEGGTITETTTRSVSGTATATFKVNTTALGGTANAVSSTEQSQAHASSNTFVAGDDIVITISANASCVDMSFVITWTRTLL